MVVHNKLNNNDNNDDVNVSGVSWVNTSQRDITKKAVSSTYKLELVPDNAITFLGNIALLSGPIHHRPHLVDLASSFTKGQGSLLQCFDVNEASLAIINPFMLVIIECFQKICIFFCCCVGARLGHDVHSPF